MSEAPMDWYKDAIIYQTHIKSFFDADNDGMGDFTGLTAKLDYIKDLGVSAIWLLPFYPSPLRDDGYDIADYTSINPSYGVMEDFKLFVREAHGRGLKVITELVINHTSDQHPWFQRARTAPAGSKYRNWYVWSDNDTLYSGTRIIFTDTEKSNWTWDPVAKQYFWHRFFSHQPDLNFDNPEVMEEIIRIMYFWLELGVDGLRLDAIPYLVERDGTSNENLPETHVVIKQLRAALDAKFPDRVFLAEANMWPEDVQHYFGDGDECHMGFHFPLMPRMYMAIAREDRHPITDIMRQTPEIPPNCQWAIFLRNHDELTLEMVTDKERDYLWETYAADKRARINVGIRRRLAPLMDNDRRKIELMNSLLMSMQGTPIVYYGDEIGMGDNIYLGDRDGVRTPMQWSPDRNGGFSRSDPAKLFLPAIMDPVYGFQATNVEAQSRNSASLLSWTKRLIAVRQSRQIFGRGTLEFLYPKNRQVLAYLRSYEDETVLCVANLSRASQAVELDMSVYNGFTPVEMLGRSRFPQIGEWPYLLTLPPYGFYWFYLERPGAKADQPSIEPEHIPVPDFITLIVTEGFDALIKGRNKAFLDHNIVPAFLPTQRWFSKKDQAPKQVDIASAGILQDGASSYMLGVIGDTTENGSYFFVPLAIEWTGFADLPQPVQTRAIAKARSGPNEGTVLDATALPSFASAVLKQMSAQSSITGPAGTVKFKTTSLFPKGGIPADLVPVPSAGEQSNSSVLIPKFGVLKFYRHLEIGIHPEIEMGIHLSVKQKLPIVPPVLGYAEIELANGEKTAVAMLHGFVENQGDGWHYTLGYLNKIIDQFLMLSEEAWTTPADLHRDYLDMVRVLGTRTAELHMALALADEDPAFSPEPITDKDVKEWVKQAHERIGATLERLKARSSDDALVRDMVKREKEIGHIIDGLFKGLKAEGFKTRNHGDFHLGNILVSGNDIVIVDFEGEPKRPMGQRRIKNSPISDVAGIIRSFDYAAWTVLERVVVDYPAKRPALEKLLFTWRDEAIEAFSSAYWATYHRTVKGQASPFEAALVKLLELDRAFYEVDYELANRPLWVHIPLSGINTLLNQ